MLRESLVEVVEYIAKLRGEDEPGCQSSAIVLNQRLWVDVLSASILKSVPQLLGLTFRQGGISGPRLAAQQGRMAGRLFALCSMWVLQRAKFTSVGHKLTASNIVGWISSCHKLG